MIVGGYELHLYCRNGTVDKGISVCKGPSSFIYNQSKAIFNGNTETETKRAARKSGWVFHHDGDVSCPWCVKFYGWKK